jgi:hypothetical protein
MKQAKRLCRSDTLLCEVVSENAHRIEFKVGKVEAVEGAASF